MAKAVTTPTILDVYTSYFPFCSTSKKLIKAELRMGHGPFTHVFVCSPSIIVTAQTVSAETITIIAIHCKKPREGSKSLGKSCH
jgi:hypothetical protein